MVLVLGWCLRFGVCIYFFCSLVGYSNLLIEFVGAVGPNKKNPQGFVLGA